MSEDSRQWRATTVVAVRKDGKVALGADGQVTLGNMVMKRSATKVRRLADGNIIAGFAGSVSDALSLFDKFEAKLKEYNSNLLRAAVELGKDWRTDKYLRNLEALLAVCDKDHSLIIAGSGEVIEPDDGILAIGSGGPYALAAARALLAHSDMDAEGVVRESLGIAADICIYTNNNIAVETL